MSPTTVRRATRRGTGGLRPWAAAAAGVLAFGLAGCSDGAGEGAPEEGIAPPSEAPQATEDAGVSGIDPTSEASPPAEGECTQLPYDDDGDYDAGEAGTARVVLEGDQLTVEEVSPAEGWEHEVATEEADEVEIEFTRDGGEESEVELHVDIVGDGLAEIEVCVDE